MEKIKTASERYPELNEIALKLRATAINKINAINPNNIESDCPYIRQCVLELLIEHLEECV